LGADEFRSVPTNGIETFCALRGEGPWLVMSHSLACDHGMWDLQIEALSRHFRVLRYDTRGHGRSTANPGPYSLDMLADDLKALIDALGIAQMHFVGLSMGGMIGQVFALKYQHTLKSLVLCDTTSRYEAAVRPIWAERIAMARGESMRALAAPTLARWFTQAFRDSNTEAMRRFGDMIASTPLEGYAGCSQALLDINVSDRLKGIKVPALVIVGAQDAGTPLAMAQAIHDNLPGSELAVIPNAAHFPNVEQPEAFTSTLLRFLRAHENAGTVEVQA